MVSRHLRNIMRYVAQAMDVTWLLRDGHPFTAPVTQIDLRANVADPKAPLTVDLTEHEAESARRDT